MFFAPEFLVPCRRLACAPGTLLTGVRYAARCDCDGASEPLPGALPGPRLRCVKRANAGTNHCLQAFCM